ncbi:glycosyltransferase family 2 protein [Brachybacterium huguangmaarense]|uniref:Glycosyltransferase family 2 protein n=1 Tax=Brachybacterium huguangmaarense TaxID=1652028 RepID=A0ABY6G2J4_9MICO|nr:glycosyltransferase family 2 protein [Brachybacterium huguangmaarense]UYG17433.1 glycosyltransferase family 2 protein [Brachybacterium huguangmaarense]
MTGSTFAVVIVNYGAHALLARNIPPASEMADACVYVVDNPSTLEECAAIRALCTARGWTLIPSPANDGFGAGVNRGVQAAIADGIGVFVLLNPDAAADIPVLSALAQEVRSDPTQVISPQVVNSSGQTEFAGSVVSLRTGRTRRGWIPDDDDPEWVNWLTGACMAFDLGAFEDLSGFDPRYFLYWEDVDFSRRAAESGRRLVVRKDLEIVHDEGGTHNKQGSRAKSHLYYYWNCRNRLRFGRRFSRVPWGEWLKATPEESWQILLRGGRRQIVSDPGTLGATIRGTVAGVAVASRMPRRSI